MVTELDRLDHSWLNARDITNELSSITVVRSLGGSEYDQTDPVSTTPEY
ncbi:hypothetical protein [Kocuria rosea]|nr:hypothetical protein [Kocuria rosea]